MNTPREDAEQVEYLRQWRKRRGCLHWLWLLAAALLIRQHLPHR